MGQLVYLAEEVSRQEALSPFVLKRQSDRVSLSLHLAKDLIGPFYPSHIVSRSDFLHIGTFKLALICI